MQTLIIMKKSPTTIPAPVIPFEDDPEYHDDDGDDTFGLLEHKTSADEVAAAAFIIVLTKKKDCGGSLPGDLLGTDRVHQALWGLHSLHNHHGGNTTATTTHPQLMLIFN